MFRFTGVTYTNFTPKGEKTPIIGFRLNFVDYPEDLPAERGVGGSVFNYFLQPAVAEHFGLYSPNDMAKLSQYVDQTVNLTFNRDGKLTGWVLPELTDPLFPAEKAKKLGA